MKSLLFILTLSLSQFVSAATLNVDGSGQLLGATGVDVNGTLYDVSFIDGSCFDVFSGCDGPDDFAFGDFADAVDAAEALGSQVFDGGPGREAFDDSPELTQGCTGASSVCYIYVPLYAFDIAGNLAGAIFFNNDDMSSDDHAVCCVVFLPDFVGVWSVWTPAPVPLPAAGYLFMTALVGLIGRKRLSRK